METKHYSFAVVIEPDEDRWRAYCPLLETLGGAAWGHSHDEAMRNIQEVVQMVVESLVEHGEPVPAAPFYDRLSTVTVSVEAPTHSLHGD